MKSIASKRVSYLHLLANLISASVSTKIYIEDNKKTKAESSVRKQNLNNGIE